MIIKKGGYWNSGIFFVRKDSLINNFKQYEKSIYRNSFEALAKSKFKKNLYFFKQKSI